MKTTTPHRVPTRSRATCRWLVALVAATGSVAVGSGAAVAAPLPPGIPLVLVSPNITGELGDGGWYVSDVTIGWSILNLSGAPITTAGCATTTITEDTAGFTSTCSVTSILGTQSYSATVARDATAPDVAVTPDRDPDANGWYRNPVSFTVVGLDALSGIGADACSAAVTHTDADGDGAGLSVGGTCADGAGTVGNGTATFSYDATEPTIVATVSGTVQPDGSYLGPVTVGYDCADVTSGIATCPATQLLTEAGVQTFGGTAVDLAGNEATTSGSVTIVTDVTPPTITWFDGPADGASYLFGSVPGAPTCEAADDDSGPAGCTVAGYETEVGTHTLVATATDLAGNQATQTRSYTVTAWTLTGFANPIDLAGTPANFNNVRPGKVATLKFEVFAGATELTSPDVVAGVHTLEVSCQAAPVVIGTTLADTTVDYRSGRFHVGWTAPGIKGRCYLVTVSALDGSTLSAYFRAK